MPSWKVHIIVAVIFVVISFFVLKYFNIFGSNSYWIFIFLPLIFLYSLLPDIDSDDSVIRQAINYTLLLLILFFVFMYFYSREILYIILIVICVFVYIFLYSLKHRGQVHSIIAGVIISLPVLIIDKYLALFCLISYISHIVVDGEFKLL